MEGLPVELLQRCHHVLIRCDQFHNQASVKAIFVTRELACYRYEVPDADNELERIQKVIDYLLYKRLIDGRPALLPFLVMLRSFYDSRDERHTQLTELCAEIDQALSNESVIPFVTVAMNRTEATALVNGDVFKDPAVAPLEQAKFLKLIDGVQDNELERLLAHYGDKRDDWLPDTQHGETIEQIVLKMTDHINQQQQRQGYPPIQPYFFSTDFFAEEDDTRLHTWDQLSWLGCVLIVDAISLFHPMIYRRLLQSEMGANERVALAIALFSPITSGSGQVNQLIKQEIGARMQRAFIRSAWHFEPLCNHEIETIRNFSQWFGNALPEAVKIVQEQKRKKRPNPTGLNWIRDKIEAPGVSALIFGGGR